MPMPREEDDDLFHDEDDVDFDDEQESEEASDEESEAKTKKKKTAKKKSATKKTAKKKASKKAPKKKAKASPKPAEDDGFGAGLDVDGSEVDESEEEPSPDETAEEEAAEPGDDADEFGRPKPQADHEVHLYELGRLKRTLDREFTAEEAHAFADQYSKVSKNYGRKAVAGKKGAQPAKVID